jgi:phage terminase small subunit
MGRRGLSASAHRAQARARATPHQHKLNDAEPELAPATTKAPKGLTGRAKAEWNRLADELVTKGVLTIGDMHAFEEYCRLVGEVDAYEKYITQGGRPEAHKLGYANYLLKLRTQLRQQAAHLGPHPVVS